MTGGTLALTLAKAYVLAAMAGCPPGDSAPHVDVYFVPEKPFYVTRYSVKKLAEKLTGNKDATHVTQQRVGNWRVFGITESRMEGTNYSISYNGLIDRQDNTKCLYVDQVNFVIRYNPVIYIASELLDYECNFKVTKLHEERHVATDLKIIRRYMPKIKMEILRYLWRYGPQGPFPLDQTEQQMSRIMKEVVTAVQPMVDNLFEEKRRHQGDIDTIENYKYESGLCPDEWPKVD